ncbi:unnamed protein product [Ostreobium quekettii]|uniref:FANCI solenoid 4 domain-containing protein n=1 Tax=Ostreobium quekettii TaxID=121088 RepID=A0A8S1IXA3_9CHLO|nr:unnamed protein product [Ostreobium quekettii]
MAHARLKIEAVVWSRLEAVARCLGELDKVVTGGSAVDRLMKVLQHMYKVLASATKHNQAPKGTNQAPPSRGFQRLVSAVHRHLTINVYALVSQLEQDEERAKGRTHAQIRWLQQQIPLLVYLVEQWEKGLIQLSKAGKVDLMRNAKRSTNRDFKIRMSQLAEDETDPEVLADGRDAEEGEEGVEEGEEGMGMGDCGGDGGDMEEKDEGR